MTPPSFRRMSRLTDFWNHGLQMLILASSAFNVFGGATWAAHALDFRGRLLVGFWWLPAALVGAVLNYVMTQWAKAEALVVLRALRRDAAEAGAELAVLHIDEAIRQFSGKRRPRR